MNYNALRLNVINSSIAICNLYIVINASLCYLSSVAVEQKKYNRKDSAPINRNLCTQRSETTHAQEFAIMWRFYRTHTLSTIYQNI